MKSPYRDVLLVDDDRVIRSVLADLLEREGFRVRHARSGLEALQIIKEECPYILITDWVMTGLDGIELCRAIRAETLPHYVYVVLLTSKSQIEDVVTGLSAGADEFLTKPVRRVELFARLQTGLRILELEDRLSQLATRDALTGLLNRRSFCDSFAKEWERSLRYGRPLSCVMMDVDYFKSINDAHGHLVGDQVLADLAKCLQRQSRANDSVCRWGGEEFCVLLPDTDGEGARSWANRCRTAIATCSVEQKGEKPAVTASFGVAQRAGGMLRLEHLIGRADAALLAAKQAGRNRVALFDAAGLESLAQGTHGSTDAARSLPFEKDVLQHTQC